MTDIDDQTLDTLQHILEDSHVGEQHAATSDQLATALGEKDSHDTNPSIRDAVRQLVNQRHVPVASSNKGYWVVADADDIEDEIQSIRDRIGALNRRVQALKQARENYDAPDATPEQVVDTPTVECGSEDCDAEMPPDERYYPGDRDTPICKRCHGKRLMRGETA